MKRYFITLMMAMLAVLAAVAQSFTGQVVDEMRTPIPFANVVLLNVSDSAYVAGTTTDVDGRFSLTGHATHPIVKISYLGYKPHVIDALSTDLGTIVLEPEATMLGEVVVKAQRPAFKLTTEGLKTNARRTAWRSSARARRSSTSLAANSKTKPNWTRSAARTSRAWN